MKKKKKSTGIVLERGEAWELVTDLHDRFAVELGAAVALVCEEQRYSIYGRVVLLMYANFFHATMKFGNDKLSDKS